MGQVIESDETDAAWRAGVGILLLEFTEPLHLIVQLAFEIEYRTGAIRADLSDSTETRARRRPAPQLHPYETLAARSARREMAGFHSQPSDDRGRPPGPRP